MSIETIEARLTSYWIDWLRAGGEPFGDALGDVGRLLTVAKAARHVAQTLNHVEGCGCAHCALRRALDELASYD